MILVVVESPSKCQTLLSILGDGYYVRASAGHIRELAKGKLGVDIANNFKPTYQTIDSKLHYVGALWEYKQISEEVIIATDADREGEAIGFHICHELNLDPKVTKRLIFNKITKKAINEAMASPKTLDFDLYHAQQSRQILDRLIGFDLSSVVQNEFKKSTLSAGRCQSPILRLIFEKDRDISDFQSKNFFEAQLQAKSMNFTYSQKIENKDKTLEFFKTWKQPEFKVKSIEYAEKKHQPPPPLITSTLQKEAATLNIGSKRCMEIAQKLYESSFITYMRTDCIQIDDEAKEMFKEHITKLHGEEYYFDHKFKSKVKNAQEAHEAIRPTAADPQDDTLSGQELAVYRLIYKRTMQSLMCSYTSLEWTILLEHTLDENPWRFHMGQPTSIGFKVMDGWNQDTLDKKKKEVDKCTSIEDKHLKKYKIAVTQKTTKPGQHYTEASLVQALEKLGIGRPSTFASLVGVVQKRGYVVQKDLPPRTEKGYKYQLDSDGTITDSSNTIKVPAMKNQLISTDAGKLVSTYLTTNFNNVVNYQFTGEMEMALDDVSNGEKVWQDVVREYYESVHSIVTKIKPDGKILGKYKDEDINFKTGPHGTYIQWGEVRKSCPAILVSEDISCLIRLLEPIGMYKDEPVHLKCSQHGYYVQWKKIMDSCTNNIEPEDAIRLIQRKQKK